MKTFIIPIHAKRSIHAGLPSTMAHDKAIARNKIMLTISENRTRLAPTLLLVSLFILLCQFVRVCCPIAIHRNMSWEAIDTTFVILLQFTPIYANTLITVYPRLQVKPNIISN